MKSRLLPQVSSFAGIIREVTGNVVPRQRYSFLEEVLLRRVRATEQPDATTYLRRLSHGELRQEWRHLIPLVTIKEAYFFRAPQQFQVLERVVLPRLMRAAAASRRLTVWSAACARGEEPATLAMVLAANSALAPWDWEIVATDVDEDALDSAQRGLYGDRAVAQVPAPLLRRFFHRRGNLWELSEGLRSRIHYQPLNLVEGGWHLPRDSFDLVFLRNVLIYFSRPLQRRVMHKVAARLAPAGYLFLGASETLWQIDEQLQPLDLGVCFAYHHPREEERPLVPPVTPAPRPLPARSPAPKAPVRADPEPPPRQTAAEPATPALAPPQPRLPTPDAPEVQQAVPEPLVPEPLAPEPLSVQQRLAEAARQLADDRLAAAAATLDEVLQADPSAVAAHALLGFLHDLGGRPEEAVQAYRAALYLDPHLYQARLLLADCLGRLGHRSRARHQYREVLASLEGGQGRELEALAVLPLPGRERAERRCRQVLRGG